MSKTPRAIKFPWLGWKWFGVGNIRKAKKLVDRNPQDANAHYQLGRALGENFDIDQAVAQSSPGSVLSQRGMHSETIEELREAIRLDPNHIEAHIFLACYLLEEGQAEEAIKICQHCFQLLPPDEIATADPIKYHWNYFVHQLLGNALNALGQRNMARLEWQKAVLISSVAAYHARKMLETYPQEE